MGNEETTDAEAPIDLDDAFFQELRREQEEILRRELELPRIGDRVEVLATGVVTTVTMRERNGETWTIRVADVNLPFGVEQVRIVERALTDEEYRAEREASARSLHEHNKRAKVPALLKAAAVDPGVSDPLAAFAGRILSKVLAGDGRDVGWPLEGFGGRVSHRRSLLAIACFRATRPDEEGLSSVSLALNRSARLMAEPVASLARIAGLALADLVLRDTLSERDERAKTRDELRRVISEGGPLASLAADVHDGSTTQTEVLRTLRDAELEAGRELTGRVTRAEAQVSSDPQARPTRKAVILTALSLEYLAVRAHLANPKEEVHEQGTVYEIGSFAGEHVIWDVLVAETGAGNDGAALATERAIQFHSPDVALFVGVAGGLKDVVLGDVVAATKVYGFETGKEDAEGFKPRDEAYRSTHDLTERARAEARKLDWHTRIKSMAGSTRPPKALVAPIAAGEKVVASNKSAVYTFLRSKCSDAVAVEMEGRGFLHAGHANQQVSTLVIRGISDLIEGKSDADAAGSQERAAAHASAFAFAVLGRLRPIERRAVAVTPVPTSPPVALPGTRQSRRELGLPSPRPLRGSDEWFALQRILGMLRINGIAHNGAYDAMTRVIPNISKQWLAELDDALLVDGRVGRLAASQKAIDDFALRPWLMLAVRFDPSGQARRIYEGGNANFGFMTEYRDFFPWFSNIPVLTPGTHSLPGGGQITLDAEWPTSIVR